MEQPIRIDVKHRDEMTPAEHLAVLRGEEGLEWGAPEGLEWAQATWHILLWDGKALAAHAGLVRRSIRVGERTLTVAGLHSVFTVPAYRSRGLAKRAVRVAMDYAVRELRATYGFLLCRAHVQALYAGLGWQALAVPVTFEQAAAPYLWPAMAMAYPFAGVPWPDGAVDLRGLPW